jgi:hypothetical protein
LKDISALPLLQHLEELAIIYCSEIKDYQPILQASRIKKLRFQGLRGIDLGFLENAPLELEEIWLSYMKRVDLRPLAGRSGLIIVADSVAEIIKPDKFYPKLRVTPSTKTRFILQN